MGRIQRSGETFQNVCGGFKHLMRDFPVASMSPLFRNGLILREELTVLISGQDGEINLWGLPLLLEKALQTISLKPPWAFGRVKIS